jgi:hypothetical protein
MHIACYLIPVETVLATASKRPSTSLTVALWYKATEKHDMSKYASHDHQCSLQLLLRSGDIEADYLSKRTLASVKAEDRIASMPCGCTKNWPVFNYGYCT